MCTVAPQVNATQAQQLADDRQVSAVGAVLLLAQAWAALGGSARLTAGLRWQGQGGPLLLLALVALPLLRLRSVRAVAQECGRVADPLWAALGWGGVWW